MSTTREFTTPFIDFPAPQILISGFHHIHMFGPGLQRYVCFENRLDQDGRPERRHSADLIVAAADVPYLIQQAAASLVVNGLHLLVRPPALVQ